MTSLPSSGLMQWINSLPKEGPFPLISQPRAFGYDENEYDAGHQSDPGEMRPGKGLLALLHEKGADCSLPAVEIGCGSGILSLGLAAGCPYPLALVTDPSLTFLRITRQKLEAQAIDLSRIQLAVLAGEEIGRLPLNSFSLIVLRSTLHHILAVDEFIRQAAQRLCPGGVLAFQEPCLEGAILMGAMIQFLPVLCKASKIKLSAAQELKVNEFVNAMSFMARRDVNKSHAEDKHLFRVDEIMRMGAACNLAVEFFPNVGFEAFSLPAGSRPKPQGFTSFLRDYTRYCMSWDASLLDLLEQHLQPWSQYIDTASSGSNGPYMHGVFICRKECLT